MFQQDLSSIVIDVGSSTTKAGYCGQYSPKFLVPSLVGQTTNEIIDESQQNNYLIGDSCLNLRKQGMQLCQVYSKGKINNFQRYQKLIEGILNQQMRIQPSHFSLLLSQNNTHDKTQRQKIASFVFQTLRIKNLFFCKSAVLSCFSTGRSTAAVINSGADFSSITPVHDGFALSKMSQSIPIGGQTLTKQVQNYIQKYLNYSIVPQALIKGTKGLTQSYIRYHKNTLLRNIKQSVFSQKQMDSQSDIVQYHLPDGKNIKINRAKIHNPFLNSSSVSQFRGLHNLISDNISQCQTEIKKQLYGNIIITGGNSLLKGLVNDIQAKVGQLAPQNVKLKLITFPFSTERRFSSWIGGSIVASLSSFETFWVGVQQWKQFGSTIFEKKCA